jgi:acid phosphatase type 7
MNHLLLCCRGLALLLLNACEWEEGAAPHSQESQSVAGSEVAVLVGAGDIAGCSWQDHDIEEPRDLGRVLEKMIGMEDHADEATARLLDTIPGTVFTTGDNVYPSGSHEQYSSCYEPTWGRHKSRTRPAPGNHDYRTPNAAGYYHYFGTAAGTPDTGYYSYTLGRWHIVVLNSALPVHGSSRQMHWLRSELESHPRRCTLAYWHVPRFSSGEHGSNLEIQTLWETLYAAGVDVVVNGHDHHYERFARQTPSGKPDPRHGIRQFIVGTGGGNLRTVGEQIAQSESINDHAHGVLKLRLLPERYEWEFVPVGGKTFSDSGQESCHPQPSVAGVESSENDGRIKGRQP